MTEITGDFLKSSEKGRGAKVRINLGERVRVGVEGEKAFGTAIIRKAGKERGVGQMFVKYSISTDVSVAYVVEKYRWLKKKGLPVVPTLRYDSKTNSLLMTDLTEGGKKIVVDRHHPLIEYGIAPDQISNWMEIRQNVDQIAVQACDGGEGMRLSYDNYAVVLEKKDSDYEGKVFLVDIGHGANFIKDLHPLKRTEVLAVNQKLARAFLAKLSSKLVYEQGEGG